MKENDESYFCRKLGSNPGPYGPESNALTTTPQSRRAEANFDCNMTLIAYFDMNETGIIPRPACSYLAAGKNATYRVRQRNNALEKLGK